MHNPVGRRYGGVRPVLSIPHSRPLLGDDVEAAAREITQSNMIGAGPLVPRFEAEFAALHNSVDAVATNSGTAALHLALLGLGVGPAHEVILPSYVCSAIMNAVRYVGAQPVLADSCLDTFNIDSDDALARVNARTKAIIVPHLFGNPVDIGALAASGVPVIEDCAQSLGATGRDGITGSTGRIAIFSFHATKVITTGGGGMIVSSDEALLSRIADLRDYDERDEYTTRYNYQMSDLAAAIGLRQLQRLDSLITRRRSLAKLYTERLASAGVKLPLQPEGGIFYRYAIRSDNRDALHDELTECGISARLPVYKPLHHYIGGELPGCDQIHRTVLSVPFYPALTDDEVETILGAEAWGV